MRAVGVLLLGVCVSFSVAAEELRDKVWGLDTVEHEPEERVWGADIELGYVRSDGNSQSATFKTRSTFTFKPHPWAYDAELEAFNAKSDGERTAERYFFANRLTYDFTEHNYFFGYASYDEDRFAGYDYRATAAAGYGRRIIDRPHMQWDAEAGPGFRRSRVRDDVVGEEDSDEAILRLFSHFRWKFGPSASFDQRVTVEGGPDNTITRSTTGLTSTLIGNVAIRLSYSIVYTKEVPDDKKHADTQTAITLLYTF